MKSIVNMKAFILLLIMLVAGMNANAQGIVFPMPRLKRHWRKLNWRAREFSSMSILLGVDLVK